ncbi:hypothetical protein K6V98_02095 [Collinsella sp. AGMB00827]|uniref:Uncharacterized protein n=1 Tax=Collinsella ureilytica TaxID=2869515 RepID=A0ABS7MIF9_9ACTN|nr:hypothetical protein [Collinsella urealyticum]MBY4797156.1 hypothetical protein [Collinsella urealyticum]
MLKEQLVGGAGTNKLAYATAGQAVLEPVYAEGAHDTFNRSIHIKSPYAQVTPASKHGFPGSVKGALGCLFTLVVMAALCFGVIYLLSRVGNH